MVLGSKDETSGCQGCVATVTHDGSLSLRLRLPDALAAQQKSVEVQGLRFAYGHENILSALACSRVISRKNAEGRRQTGQGSCVEAGLKLTSSVFGRYQQYSAATTVAVRLCRC